MLTHDLMTQEVEMCTFEDTAQQAASIMSRRNCGFVPVVLDHETKILVAVLTDRDLVLFLSKTNRRPSEVKVGEFCTRFPKTVFANTEIHEVEELMKEYQIHRLPVIDNVGKIIGVISLKDLADEAWRDVNDFQPEVSEREIAEIVEVISRAR